MSEDQTETPSLKAEKARSDSAAREAKAKRASEKPRRTHSDRAVASIRAAKRGMREVSDPLARARILLAEANVLALLELAAALAEPATPHAHKDGGAAGAD